MENEDHGRNKATLRIHSEVTSVETITDTLKIEPDGFKVKGSKAVPNHPKSYVYPANLWRLESDLDESESLEQHILRLVEFVEGRKTVFEELIKTCEVDIFCGYFPNHYTGQLSLPPDTLKRLAIIPIKVIVKLYPPSSEDEL